MKNLITALTLGFLLSIGMIPVRASGLENKEFKDRGKLVSSKYLCNESCVFHPETEYIDDKGQKLYKKRVDVKRLITEVNKEKDAKADIDFEIIFTYDKKSFANAETANTTANNVYRLWKIKDVSEIRPGKSVCLATDRYVIYKKGNIGIKDELMEGHADVLCSTSGEIGLNTNLS